MSDIGILFIYITRMSKRERAKITIIQYILKRKKKNQ